MEYNSYEFLEGDICVVAYCNVELAVCILFVIREKKKKNWIWAQVKNHTKS